MSEEISLRDPNGFTEGKTLIIKNKQMPSLNNENLMNSKIIFSETCAPGGTYIHAYTHRYSQEMKQAQTQKEIEQRSHSQWKTNK